MGTVFVGTYTSEGHDVSFEVYKDDQVEIIETCNGKPMPSVVVDLSDARAKQDQLSKLGYQLV